MFNKGTWLPEISIMVKSWGVGGGWVALGFTAPLIKTGRFSRQLISQSIMQLILQTLVSNESSCSLDSKLDLQSIWTGSSPHQAASYNRGKQNWPFSKTADFSINNAINPTNLCVNESSCSLDSKNVPGFKI